MRGVKRVSAQPPSSFRKGRAQEVRRLQDERRQEQAGGAAGSGREQAAPPPFLISHFSKCCFLASLGMNKVPTFTAKFSREPELEPGTHTVGTCSRCSSALLAAHVSPATGATEATGATHDNALH